MPEMRRVQGLMNMAKEDTTDTYTEDAEMVKKFYTMLSDTLLQHNKDIARLKRKVRALTMLTEAERVPPDILKERLHAREGTIRRAKEQFELDYADSSNGTLPYGNQIGRRYLIPQDLGVKSWDFEKPDEHSPDPTPDVREEEAKKVGRHTLLEYRIVDEEAFLIIHGFKYKPLDGDPKLQSVLNRWAGVVIPPSPISFTNARIIGGYYTVNLEVSPAISPKSMVEMTAYFNDLGPHKYQLAILGEVIGTRRYLIKQPQDLLIR